MKGEATHAGLAKLLATRDIDSSVHLTEETYRKRLEGQMILSEELPAIEQDIELTKRAVALYAEHYAQEDFQVLHPEVEFLVSLPNTLHHCYFFHELLFPDIPYRECNAGERNLWEGKPYGCWQPHFLAGRTDAVINWKRMVWLLEHKTTSIGEITKEGVPSKLWINYLASWLLDNQPTGYVYGIWKATGLRPHGFILNIIKLPRKNKYGLYTDLDDLGYAREPYVKSDEDLLEFEREIIQIAGDLERAVIEQHLYKDTRACFDYNRVCYYHDMCKRHGVPAPGEFRVREPDYVELAYRKILGSEAPNGG